MQWIRARLTYGNVMATIAVFAALGLGTAWALERNSVKSRHIKNNQVQNIDVRDGTLGTGEFSSAIPAVHVTHSASQSVQDNETTIAFNTERYDTADMHDNTTDNSRLIAPVSGVYAVTAQVRFDNVATDGDRELALRKNGTTDIGRAKEFAGGAGTTPVEVATQVKLAAGDYVDVRADESGTGGHNVSKTDEFSPEFAMTWLAPG